MSRYELTIEEIVLRDVAPSESSDLGPLVEERLATLARGGEAVARLASDEVSLADLVARRIWSEVRRATTEWVGPTS
jgi:hypothetical protein